MVVVDTNVLAYLLIEGDRTALARALLARDPEWRSESFVLVEFCNILATCVRAGSLAHASSERLLAEADRRVSGLVTLPHRKALQVALELGVSGYDARFLGAARTLGTRLVTEDTRLRAAAPRLTQSLAEAIEGRH